LKWGLVHKPLFEKRYKATAERRFTPRWSVEEDPACVTNNGQQLAGPSSQ